MTETSHSQRRACALVGMDPKTYRLLPLPIGSYAFFHATPGQIAWGMVASLAVYNVYIVWETIRFLTGKIVRASPQETTALGHPS